MQIESGCPGSQVAYVRSCLNLTGKDSRCEKAAQEVLQRQYYTAMHAEEKASFKVAFVVFFFVMATLFAPPSKHDHSRTDFWAALGRPNEIGSYDWSSYVIGHLLFAAAKLQSDLTKNIHSPLITGCILFLQVLYLGSIDLGVLNMPHNSFPRSQWFTPERIRAMLAADTVHNLRGMVNIEFGASTPRPSAEVCYTWAKMSGRAQQHSTTTRLFDAAMHWVSVLNISEEAAISIFFAMMQSREIINDKIDELEVILFDVICVIVKSYQNGFRSKLQDGAPRIFTVPSNAESGWKGYNFS
ncbi:uncharacterized protein LOC111257874 isoform X4 [Setaria italica]|uniref:uncharacterized protein LOC111257874 isoform X4 n=1 Tax=Setaria italica TaxID=4555 RepID=UPI000BE4C044|nr:uncharacterized protein LOC111257874 isoform X4 [Setaria italica]